MKGKGVRILSIRVPFETWEFLKDMSKERQLAINVIINERLNYYKKSCEKVLTSDITVVS